MFCLSQSYEKFSEKRVDLLIIVLCRSFLLDIHLSYKGIHIYAKFLNF